jgi:cytidylate kinase
VKRIVTISAGYGAGGSVVAPAVADALGYPFLDRAVPGVDVAQEAASEEERTGGLWSRVLAALAQMPTDAGTTGALTVVGDDAALRKQAEARLREFVGASDGVGVILGWAGVLVVPDAYHVRLTGPADARAQQGGSIEGIPEDEARRRLDETDRTRSLYWRRLYKRDWSEPELYHLAVDSTAVGLDATRELVVTGARAFWDR